MMDGVNPSEWMTKRRNIMRIKKLTAFLLAVILCVSCVSAALAKPRELTPEESDAMEKRICKLFKAEGFDIDWMRSLSRVDISYTSDGYSFTLVTVRNEYYHAKFRGTRIITNLTPARGYEGVPMKKPKLDKKTMKRVEKKVDSFLKKVNSPLRKKMGKLKVVSCVKDGKKTYVEIMDSKKKVNFTLLVTSSAVRVWRYNEMKKK